MNLINYIRYWGISSQRSNFELHHWLHQVLGTQRLHYIKNYIYYIYMCVYLLCIHRHLYHSLMFFIYLHIYTMKFVVSVRHHCRISSRMCDSIHGISAGKPLRGLGVIFTWFVTFIYLYHYIYMYMYKYVYIYTYVCETLYVYKPILWLTNDSLMILMFEWTWWSCCKKSSTNNQHPCGNSGLLLDPFFSRSYDVLCIVFSMVALYVIQSLFVSLR